MDNAKNFAKATVSLGYDASATSIALSTGHGAKLPSVPFNATWWESTTYPDPSDDPNVEIVRVTNISTDTLTITRAQESTSASTKNTAGKVYKLGRFITAKEFNTDIPAAISTAVSAAASSYTPATSGTSILKGNGSGGTTAAVSGTDYAPATSGSAVLKGNGAGGTASAVAGTDIVTPTGTETLTNKTLTSPILTTPSLGVATATSINGSTVPASETLVGRATTDTLTNKTLTTPTIGSMVNANHNHQNAAGGGALDAAAITSGQFPIARLASGTPTGSKFIRDDGVLATPAGGGTLNSTDIDTSAKIKAIVTDETGSGALVFATSPTLVTPNIGAATGTSLTLSGSVGTVTLSDGGTHSYAITPQTMTVNTVFIPDTAPTTGFPFHTAAGSNLTETHVGSSGTGNVLRASKIDDTAYDATSWNGNTDAPTKNAVRDKIESMGSGGLSPTTTRGDLIYRDASADARLAIGAFSARLISDGTDPVWKNIENAPAFFDDFLGGPTGDTGWTNTANSGQITISDAESGRPGCLFIGTSTSATSTPVVNKALNSFVLGSGKLRFAASIQLQSLSDGTQTYTLRIGFGDAAAPVDGAWFEYTHSAASGNWVGKTFNNSASTTASGGSNVAVAAGSWVKLEIVVNAAGTQVDFYIGGTLIGSSTTNIPITQARATNLWIQMAKSVGTTSRYCLVDYVAVEQIMTTAR